MVRPGKNAKIDCPSAGSRSRQVWGMVLPVSRQQIGGIVSRSSSPPGHRTGLSATVVIPTFNEGSNVAALVRRLDAALQDRDVDLLFVDDSSDDTPAVIMDTASQSVIPVGLIHRVGEFQADGLSGAVCTGIRQARSDRVVVMDGDLQHPPELVPHLLDLLNSQAYDVVVASRYCGQGDSGGLSSGWRRAVSSTSTLAARGMFPVRVGRKCTDPMTGFFGIDRRGIDLAVMEPRGFKILFEILARFDLRVTELPFVFGERFGGASKASWRQGIQFLAQLVGLRMRSWSKGSAAVTVADRTADEVAT